MTLRQEKLSPESRDQHDTREPTACPEDLPPGLRYVDDSRQGYTREWKNGAFVYFNSQGRPLSDEADIKRINALAAPGGNVGFAWNATQEAFYGEFSDKLIVVDYEALCREPKRTLEIIYAKLGLEPFEHDFDDVVYGEGDTFDAELGVPGLHAVGRQARFS